MEYEPIGYGGISDSDLAESQYISIPRETIALSVVSGAVAGVVATAIELPILLLVALPALAQLFKP